MTPKRRIGLAASVVAIAGAFGALPAAAQTQPAAPVAGEEGAVGGGDVDAIREENRRLTEYAQQLQRRMALEQTRHELEQQALDAQAARAAEAERREYLRDYQFEHARTRALAETERRRTEDRHDLARATERDGRRAFFPRTTAGMPGECYPRNPAVPNLGADPQTLQDVLGNLQQCYYSFAERGEPFINRRAAYSTVAGVGALGGAIGGEAIAASTAAAWGGLVLLPIIIEGTVDRPEFDSLDRVTARGLNWVNGRAVQMDAIERRLGNEREALSDQVSAFNTEWTKGDGDRARLQRLITADASAEGDPSPEVTSPAALRIQQSIEEILDEARETRRDLHGSQEHIRDLLPTWTQMRFNRVMDNYSSHRRDMTLRPQAAARSIVALPFSSVASFIRGDDDKVRTANYFTSSVAATLRDLHSPMNLPALRSREPTAIDYLDLSSFPESQHDAIRDMVDRANSLQEETMHARALLAHARAVDEQGAPLFDEVGAVAAQNEAAAGESQRAANETPPTPAPAETPATPAEETPAPADGDAPADPAAPTDPAPAGED